MVCICFLLISVLLVGASAQPKILTPVQQTLNLQRVLARTKEAQAEMDGIMFALFTLFGRRMRKDPVRDID